MNTKILKPHFSAVIGLMLTLPSAYFVLSSILKYVIGFPGMFDAANPLLTSWGINEPMGWNVNALILFGPGSALLLNLSSVLSMEWTSTPKELRLHLYVERHGLSWFVIGLSACMMLLLFVYAAGENCNC